MSAYDDDESGFVTDEKKLNQSIILITAIARKHDFEPRFDFYADGGFKVVYRFGRAAFRLKKFWATLASVSLLAMLEAVWLESRWMAWGFVPFIWGMNKFEGITNLDRDQVTAKHAVMVHEICFRLDAELHVRLAMRSPES